MQTASPQAKTGGPLPQPVPGQARVPQPITRDLVDYIRRTTYDDLPVHVREEGVRAFENFVGCAFGGCRTETADAGLRAVSSFAGSPVCRLLGRRERLDPVNAALINCLTSAAHAYDDTHLKTVTHPTGPVAAAALALGEIKKASGRDVLLAIILGMEAECRVADELMAPDAGTSGSWYMTGVAGGIGAAVAAARLLNLDAERAAWALSLAAAQASGFRVTHGSMACAMVPAYAARDGITAALMAEAGVTSSLIPFEGTHGYLHVFGPQAPGSRMTEGFGKRYEFLENAYKPYPCGIVIHPAIDACLELGAQHKLKADEIERVDLAVPQASLTLTGRRNPATPLEAQVSLFHWVAATLVTGDAGLAALDIACLKNPRVLALQDRVHAVADATLASDQTRCKITLKNGRVAETFVEHATGSMARPMTPEQLERKFRGQAEPVLGKERTTALLALCRDLPNQPSLEVIMTAALP